MWLGASAVGEMESASSLRCSYGSRPAGLWANPLERGVLGQAKDVLKILSASHADHGATEKLTLLVLSTEEEESK